MTAMYSRMQRMNLGEFEIGDLYVDSLHNASWIYPILNTYAEDSEYFTDCIIQFRRICISDANEQLQTVKNSKLAQYFGRKRLSTVFSAEETQVYLEHAALLFSYAEQGLVADRFRALYELCLKKVERGEEVTKDEIVSLLREVNTLPEPEEYRYLFDEE